MKVFVEKYGQNADAQIGMVELVQILPTDENFLLFFRQQLKSCAEFMQAWRRYDADHSGYIEADELKSFLRDLLQKAKKSYDDKKLEEYTQTTLKMFDSNNDGKLCLAEMARLLPHQENFLLKFQNVKMPAKEFNKIFELYDQVVLAQGDSSGYVQLLRRFPSGSICSCNRVSPSSRLTDFPAWGKNCQASPSKELYFRCLAPSQDGNGYMDENELDALLKDLCEKNKKVLDINNIATYKITIMALSDGGKLYRTELALVLCADEN
ncbi:UNVERIFIED_CONTAM: hypothetical protein FKN15_036619 [Acipenser sinensis]